MKKGNFLAAGGSAILAAAMAGSAWAQAPAPAEDGDAGGGIIVTAERRATDLQKTAIAISAFTPETLEQRNITNVRDLAGQVAHIGDVALLQRFRREGGNRDRGLLKVRGAPLGGDDDTAAGVAILCRRWRLCPGRPGHCRGQDRTAASGQEIPFFHCSPLNLDPPQPEPSVNCQLKL